MKREICCESCAQAWEAAACDPEVVAAGESVTVVRGSAMRPYVCDGCAASIEQWSRCAAITVLTRGQSVEPEWEAQYLARAS